MTYRFGDFSLDHDTRQLLLNGDEVHLSPKAFELLTVLLANQSRAVSKAELQGRLWPSTFVEETNLAGLVAEIRRSLHDTASSPRFVRTVYGFGYRFVGDVKVDAGAIGPGRRVKLCLTFDKREIVLMNGANVVGRAPDATIPIDSPGVSRYHARIVVSEAEATLEDLGSKNGTYVNGKRITASRRLSGEDEIGIGAIALRFRIAPPTTPTQSLTAEND
ncbi:MAG: FHA domain-containing protein [Vicinamibacterales bacterium]